MYLKFLTIFLITITIAHLTNGSLPTSLSRRSVNASGNAAVSSLSNQQTDVSISYNMDTPWENFITPGPTIISLLGNLMVISGKVDFSLTENAPIKGFKYIRHPSSFRAILVQVSNDGWGAFMNAHKNMDTIQLYMQQIPAHIKTALKILLDASPNLVKRLLPITLEQIEDIGKQCVMLYAETETKFTDVMMLLGEIGECIESTRGRYDAKYLAAQIELNVSAVQKQYLDDIGQNLKNRQAQIDAHVKKYQDAYDKALKEIPTGWKTIAQDFVRSMVNMVNVIPGIMGAGKDGSGGQYSIGQQYREGDFQTVHLLGIMSQFTDQIAKLKDGIVKVFNNRSGGVQQPSGMFESFSVTFNILEGLLSNTTGQAGEKSMKMIQRAKQVCIKLQNLYKNVLNLNITEDVKTAIIGEVKTVDHFLCFFQISIKHRMLMEF